MRNIFTIAVIEHMWKQPLSKKYLYFRLFFNNEIIIEIATLRRKKKINSQSYPLGQCFLTTCTWKRQRTSWNSSYYFVYLIFFFFCFNFCCFFCLKSYFTWIQHVSIMYLLVVLTISMYTIVHITTNCWWLLPYLCCGCCIWICLLLGK